MENNTDGLLTMDTNLINELKTLATERGTNIETLIKLLIAENHQLKKKPDNYIVDTKVSKSKNGKSKAYTYSTVIPKPIVNKFRLDKGQALYWDIDDYKIIITPEINPVPTPEEASIQAGYDILNDMLINGNTTSYLRVFSNIKTYLNAKDRSNNDKVNSIVNSYTKLRVDTEKEAFKQVVSYLLDYPLNLPDQYEILNEVYKEITKSDTSSN